MGHDDHFPIPYSRLFQTTFNRYPTPGSVTI